MNNNDRFNESIRRDGTVFLGGTNRTRCSRCGEPGAEYMGDHDDDGESIALCSDGCVDDDVSQ